MIFLNQYFITNYYFVCSPVKIVNGNDKTIMNMFIIISVW